MKTSKKILSVILAIIIGVSCLSIIGSAVRDESYCPTIIIPGLFQSETHYYENGELAINSEGKPYEAPFFLDTTPEIAGAALTKALLPISKMLIEQKDKEQEAAHALADVIGKTLMEKNKCDENGKFIHDIRAAKYNVSYAELSDHHRNHIIDEVPIYDYIDIAGEENFYVFSYASLGNMIDTATELFDFIALVKERTGANKVNLVPISQGGSITNALMQIYADKGISMARDINRIVFVVPALNGSSLIGETFEYGFLDDSYELYSEMFPALMGDDDFASYLVNILIRIMPNADLNNILDIAVDTLVNDYMKYSTLLWGLCPSENYPGSRAKFLANDKGAAKIMAQTDWFYNAELNSDQNILNAIDDGVKVFDIVAYNYELYHLVDSYNKVNADGIIQLDSTSMGAYSLGVNKTLPDGYVPVTTNCSDPANHNHIDPRGIIDAGAGLLPETTFYFYNQNHEKTGRNDVIMKLASKLLTDESFTSVHSYPDKFPQFNEARISRDLIRDVEAMKEYDLSNVPPEIKANMETAIANAEAEIADTVVDGAEFEVIKREFYDARDSVFKAESGEQQEDSKKGFDFNSFLTKLLKLASDLLYHFFGGSGFSEFHDNLKK